MRPNGHSPSIGLPSPRRCRSRHSGKHPRYSSGFPKARRLNTLHPQRRRLPSTSRLAPQCSTRCRRPRLHRAWNPHSLPQKGKAPVPRRPGRGVVLCPETFRVGGTTPSPSPFPSHLRGKGNSPLPPDCPEYPRVRLLSGRIMVHLAGCISSYGKGLLLCTLASQPSSPISRQ